MDSFDYQSIIHPQLPRPTLHFIYDGTRNFSPEALQ